MGKGTYFRSNQSNTNNFKIMKISIPQFSKTGEKIEALSLDIAEKFSTLNVKLVSQALYVEQNRVLIKAGLAKTKGEVRGGGRKPYKQKGTGRARAGSNRSPLWRGGGITFGPTGINKVLQLPKKMKEMAFLQLIVAKAVAKEMSIIDDLKIESKKTKDASKVIEKIADGKRLEVFVTNEEINDCLAYRNLAQINCNSADKLMIATLSSAKTIVFTKEAFKNISAKLSK